MTVDYKLPNSWIEAAIEDHIDFIDYRGKTPNKIDTGLRLITAKNVKKGFLHIEPREYVDPAIYDEWMTRGIPKKGDVLFTTEAPLGNVAQLDTDEMVVFAQRIIIMQPNPERIDASFLKYMLLSDIMQRRIEEKGTGATAKGIKSKLLKQISIAFPNNVAEQKRIVAILDEAFGAIAKAKENAEKNLANAKELFDSYLNRVLTEKGEGWKEKKLIDLCVIGDGNHSSKYPKKSEMVETGVPFIRAGNIVDGKLSSESLLFISEEKHQILKKGHLKTGDVIFTNRGAGIGKVALVDSSFDGSNLNSQLAWLRCKSEINSCYLYYYMLSGNVQRICDKIKTGAALPQLTIKTLNGISVKYPSKYEQAKLEEEISRTQIQCRQLELGYSQKLNALEELKQSILQKAFTGQLTAKSPELEAVP